MLFRVGRCLLCGLRSVPKRCNAITVLGSGVHGKRTVTDSRRPPGLEELIRSDVWNGYLQRLQQWEAKAAQTAEAGQQGAPPWECGEKPRWRSQHILPVIQELRTKENELNELQQLLADENEDLKALAHTEVASCVEEIIHLKYQIAWLLIPREEVDDCNLILEVTAGVGGQEAMLFTAEIFEMYQRYAANKKWSFDVLEYFDSDLGGVRHASASVGGLDAYKHLKYEGGVHRVQRVPKTEKQGRMHTSTMTVAVLPQPSEINLTIHPKDLRIETKKASGAGGQHVNTTDSAVRIVHIPTGIAVECQQERSQIKNKDIAMKVLRAKLYNMKLEEETLKRQSARKIQVGTKGRSEKIRTYNFQQDRITDHRINKSMNNLEGFLLGDELLDEMIQALSDFADYESLVEIISN
ncbi:PREDICTED: peptide chain release factor 1-like, mitochondrial [Nanorana parkeri]|uniref:peptide chain release factor 1-like, mitochondrial n=1 Tax=Nanorana parkeri TaxID=125878 RepID=UPI0008543648|nr:PREDICTED: peptide chain release factor 1-like, mitochondrial [Nanorana parkeri]